MQTTRRGLIGLALAAAAAPALASPAGPELGVQLWMVRQSMAADFGGTLERLAALGVRKVELAGAPELSGAQLRRAFDGAGLQCVSGHLPMLQMTDAEAERRLAFAAEVGMTDVVAPMPGFAALLDLEPARRLEALMAHAPTAGDWAWNAGRLNALGARAKAAGLRLSYHNHNLEFAGLEGGGRAIDLLLARTDPDLADFQLDVGNAVLGGGDPFALLAAHPRRFRSAHLKDWRAPLNPTTAPASPPSAPLGEGVIDWRRWKAAAGPHLKTAFVEQENLPQAQEIGGAAQALAYLRRL